MGRGGITLFHKNAIKIRGRLINSNTSTFGAFAAGMALSLCPVWWVFCFKRRMKGINIKSVSGQDVLSSDIGPDHKLDDLNWACNTFTAEISIMGDLTALSSVSNWNVRPLRQSEISSGLKLMRVLLIAGFLLYFKSKLEQLKFSPPRSSLSWLAPLWRALEESGCFRYLRDGCTLWGNLKYKIKCKQKPN